MVFSATIGLSIIFATMILMPGIPPVYRSMLSVPNMCLENAMACRVYRAVKLGFIKNHHSTSFELSIRSSLAPDRAGHEFGGESRNTQVKVDITRTTDMKICNDDVSGRRLALAEEDLDSYSQV